MYVYTYAHMYTYVIYIYMYMCTYVYIYGTFSFLALSEARPFPSRLNAHSPSVTQQTYLPCDTADMSAVGHSRHICCVTQQNCLL